MNQIRNLLKMYFFYLFIFFISSCNNSKLTTLAKSPTSTVNLASTAPADSVLARVPASNPAPVVALPPAPAPAATPAPVPVPVTSTALATDSIFKPTSFWYTEIPANAPLHPNSSNFVTDFIRQKTTFYNNVTINTYSYASPVYIVDGSVAPVKVGFNNCQSKTYVDPVFTSMMSAVPIPSYALQSAGTDGEMVIYQPSTHSMWEMWKAAKNVNGSWTACWGGKMSDTSNSSGINQVGYGTTASGLPFIGGQVTAEELTRGEIRHAIGISLVDLEKFSIFSWPANRSDGYNPNNVPNRIAEGQRFRLDSTVNVDSLAMTRAGKTIAKAAQKYGFVVWDKAGAVSIRAQNALSYTALGKPNPYPALYENKPAYAVLDGFPWSRLQFLPMNYGKPVP